MKPVLLEALLARGEGPVVFIDADGCVYDSFDPLAELAARHSLVLSPHLFEAEPVWRPQDSLEEVILGDGVFNTGLVGVAAGAEPFLAWWRERTGRRTAFGRNTPFDQEWVTLAAGLFEHCVLQDRGFNVAGWNIGRRDVEWTGAAPMIDGGPLRHFHFALGFDPNHPEQLAAPSPRPLPGWFPRLEHKPGVARLAREYAQRLIGHGYDQAQTRPVRYASTPGGVPLEPWMRARYRAALVDAEFSGGDEPPNPFTDGDARFLEWLGTPLPAGADAALIPEDELRIRVAELEQIRDDAVAWAQREAAERQAVVAERDLLAGRLDDAQAVMASVWSSPSWRLTRPLRGAKVAVKGRRRGPSGGQSKDGVPE
jgi:hypothetical protein